MSIDTECHHDLPMREKMFASKGKGRTCPSCGADIFVRLPFLSGVLGVSPLMMAVLLAFAWTDGGTLWFWFIAAIAAHIVLYIVELRFRIPEQYDHADYHKHTKRNYILLGVIVVSFGLLLYLVS